MVLEVATFDVTPGREPDFTRVYHQAKQLVADSEGCRSMRMTRGVESPARFILLIEWDSVEAHEQGFRQTERFTAWRAAIGEFFATPPHVEHYAEV